MLGTYLTGLTKQGLNQVRMHYGIQGVSSLKKQELVDVLVQQIPDKLANILYVMDDTRYNIAKRAAERGRVDKLSLEYHRLNYFQELALLIPSDEDGKADLVMPEEIQQAMKRIDRSELQQVVARNTEWVKLTLGMLYYYGTLSLSELQSRIEDYTGTNLDSKEYEAVILQAALYYDDIQLSPKRARYQFVEDWEQLEKEQQRRTDLSYYPFTKEELLQAGEVDFVDRTPIYRNFVKLIRNNYSISEEEADFIVEECVISIRNGKNTSELFKELQSKIELDEVELIKAVMEQSIMLHNHTRQWTLKGYTPNQLSASRSNRYAQNAESKVVSIHSAKKIGRNDPCPCGSGKKYKKCCISKEQLG
ncbi:YecA family protein [Paenibacillus rigui]|uniref:Zinc chelation protein SecC n=1 Tax=Paenibacillus rigui TaxID=554312 RepID=A0A229UMM1_9BACL|nr:SEC-C metal-binding domain-containing protein [Paenibacillus rigui]OXM84535.1 hypothetical protein CF651_20050 [Paenibacillus rigui]